MTAIMGITIRAPAPRRHCALLEKQHSSVRRVEYATGARCMRCRAEVQGTAAPGTTRIGWLGMGILGVPMVCTAALLCSHIHAEATVKQCSK